MPEINFIKYRKLPIEVHAIQYQECFLEQIEKLLQTHKINYWRHVVSLIPPAVSVVLIILTLEGQMKCEPNDYLILGIEGECYPCKAHIFRQTYEKVK